jgi:hypothetical protein
MYNKGMVYMKQHSLKWHHKIGSQKQILSARQTSTFAPAILGLPHDSVLAYRAPHISPSYIRSSLKRAMQRVRDIFEDPTLPVTLFTPTMAWIGDDDVITIAHKNQSQITLYARDIYSGRVKSMPLIKHTKRKGLHVTSFDLYRPPLNLKRSDEIYICIETALINSKESEDERCRHLANYFSDIINPVEQATDYLVRVKELNHPHEVFSLTLARIDQHRDSNLLIAHFEGYDAASRRVASAMVPILKGILQCDIVSEGYDF